MQQQNPRPQAEGLPQGGGQVLMEMIRMDEQELMTTPTIHLGLKWEGYNAKHYMLEHEKHQEIFNRKLNEKEARIAFEKIKRHFKLNNYLRLEFTNNVGGGKCYGQSLIQLRYETDYGILCHELGHALTHQKYGNIHHNRKMYRQMERIIKYCKKKNFWESELQERTTPKPVMPEPTKDEIKMQKIQKAQEKIQHYEKKLRFYQKKQSKAKRSLAMLSRNYLL